MTSNWRLRSLVAISATLMALPAMVVFGSWLFPQWESWAHLVDTVLFSYVSNTLILAFGVALLSGITGTWCAWCISQYRFPFSSTLRWMLFLPLVFPPYIMAYLYTGVLDFSGPVQQLLRDLSGLSYGEYWFPDVQSMPGAIFVISAVLFPYVYGMAYVAFSSQSQSLEQVARIHGQSESGYFWRVALPMASPAILAGMALTMMEAFADFGTVEYLGVATFTTGIFRTWFGMNQPLVAAQLSAGLVCFVLFLLWIEKQSRKKQRFYQSGQGKSIQVRSVSKVNNVLIFSSLLLVLGITFFVPLLRLLSWAWLVLQASPDIEELVNLLGNSFLVAGLAAAFVILLGLMFSYTQRGFNSKPERVIQELATTGYAFPGAVIAVGTVMVLGKTDIVLNDILNRLFAYQPGLLFSGTLFALVFAYVIRYLTVGHQYVSNGLMRVNPSLDQAAKSFGESDLAILRRVHFPLLKSSLLVGLLMVFVDVLKELPATLILRPFNFDTLAVKTYELASDERLADASLPAVFIVLAGFLPVWVIQKNMKFN